MQDQLLLMKALETEITQLVHSSVAVMVKKGRMFSSPLHCHPELELVCIKSGYGNRIIGNNIDRFEPGDVVLIGPGIPHRWISDTAAEQNTAMPGSIVAYFHKDVFNERFYELKETAKLSGLIASAGRGIVLCGDLKEVVGAKMNRLPQKAGFKKIIALLDILHIISVSTETKFIAEENYSTAAGTLTSDKLYAVYEYIKQNYKNDIPLEEIANLAHLAPTAFCRLFKKRTGKSFVEYLKEIRISHACSQLLTTDLNVDEVAPGCGFKTISNFNKAFKQITSFSPGKYRQLSRKIKQ